MWNRRRTWLVLLAISSVALAVYFEPTRCVRGWLHGEAFFEGRPTSYWRNVIVSDLQTDTQVLLGQVPPPPPSWWERGKKWVGYEPRTFSSLQLVNDKNADLILTCLRDDPNEKIAGFARDIQTYRKNWQFEGKMDFDPALFAWMGLVAKHNLKDPNSDLFKHMMQE